MWRRLWVILLVLGLCLMPSTVLAQDEDTADVTITATGMVVDAPGGFTVTYISDYEIGLSWTKPEEAEKTMIRAALGREPTNPEPGEEPTDGMLVYFGEDTSCTHWTNLETTSVPMHYKAWCQTASGDWGTLHSSGLVEGLGMITIAFIVLALGVAGIAIWKKHYMLYLAGFIGCLLIALHLGQTYWAMGLPIGLMSGYMLYEFVAWWF